MMSGSHQLSTGISNAKNGRTRTECTIAQMDSKDVRGNDVLLEQPGIIILAHAFCSDGETSADGGCI